MLLGSAATLTATASPSSVFGEAATATVTTSATTASASGSVGAVSYAWVKVSGDAITINSASSAATTFSGAAMGLGEVRSAVFKCVVTDSIGSADTNNVTAQVERV